MPAMDQLAPYCAHISHRVRDPDRWKAGFDDLEGTRRDTGILGHHINRSVDDPHLITVFLPLTDLEPAASFTSAYGRAEVRSVLGIESHPRIEWLEPVREAIVLDRQVPAFLLPVHVADLDAWLDRYDALTTPLEGAGVIGHAVRRTLDDPPSIVLYHQAETFDSLHDLLAEPEAWSGLLGDGVTDQPAVTFHTGGWAKTY